MNIIFDAINSTISKQVNMPYLLAMPDSSVPSPWPLILFLHGSGERGTDFTDIVKRGLPKELVNGRKIPFLVVAPQCPPKSTWSVHLDALMAFIEDLQSRYTIDSARIFITGMSMGGTGTWHLACTFPDRFAAIVPVCGDSTWYVGDPIEIIDIRHLPVWVFHGEQDGVIPVNVSQTLVNALQKCGGNVRFTVYPDVGHNCWNQVYATSELYSWLSSQRSAV
jgi:predicted peptidase